MLTARPDGGCPSQTLEIVRSGLALYPSVNEAQNALYCSVAINGPLGGRVLRCLINDDENGRAVVEIDDQELGIEEFARLLGTYAGWGMRIEFVPEDEIHRRPALQVREPDAT